MTSYIMNPMALRMFSAAAANSKVRNQKKDKKTIINAQSVT